MLGLPKEKSERLGIRLRERVVNSSNYAGDSSKKLLAIEREMCLFSPTDKKGKNMPCGYCRAQKVKREDTPPVLMKLQWKAAKKSCPDKPD